MEKLLVIDGNSIINRAFYGVRPLTTKDGMHTNAIYGMINIIEKHLHALNPEYAAVAFDLKAPTFRHKMYDAYKAGRRATPEELLEQFAPAKDVLRAMGFTIVEKEGYEADDIIGTLASAAAKEGKQAYVLTGDRDSLQLIGDGVTVLLATNTDTVNFDRAAFVEHYGVEPSQFVDVKAIMGDKSDNIPGVAGIGEKGALKFISEFGTLEKLYEALESTDKISEKQKEKLRADRDNAFLSQTLARIDTNAPCGITVADTKMQETDRAALYSLFTKLEFNVFLKRYGLGEDDLPTAEAAEEAIVHTDAATLIGALTGKPFAFAPFENGFSFSDGEKLYLADGDLADLAPLLTSDGLICHDLKSLCALTAPHGFYRARMPMTSCSPPTRSTRARVRLPSTALPPPTRAKPTRKMHLPQVSFTAYTRQPSSALPRTASCRSTAKWSCRSAACSTRWSATASSLTLRDLPPTAKN